MSPYIAKHHQNNQCCNLPPTSSVQNFNITSRFSVSLDDSTQLTVWHDTSTIKKTQIESATLKSACVCKLQNCFTECKMYLHTFRAWHNVYTTS